MRDGERLTVEVTLGSSIASANAPVDALDARLAGVVLVPNTADTPAADAPAPEGVLVVTIDPQSPAFAAGLRERDVIVSVNQNPVGTPQELNAVAASDEDKLLLHVHRGEDTLFVAVG